MNGALLNATSRIAIAAAAGLVWSVSSASAADLGGNCCADLEERVAELEATTARKGNRKMSLTIYGHVNRSILYYNDGSKSNTFPGIDNHNSATRFGLMGNAAISPAWKAGYSLLLDVADKARSSGVGQKGEEGPAISPTNNLNDDHIMRLRDANVWIEQKELGRLTLGRLTNAGQDGLIDLAGTQAGVGSDPACTGGSVFFRNSTSGLLTSSISNLSLACGGIKGIRMEGIKYTSPAFAGFILDASIGESLKVETSNIDDPAGQVTNLGRVMGLSLRYAGEFSGFRLAAAAGAEWSKANENNTQAGLNSIPSVGILAGGGTATLPFGVLGTNVSADNQYWALAGALMHVSSGLFVQGHYMKATMAAQDPLTGDFADDRDATRWDIQAGIAKNWFGIGNTVLLGEYGRHEDWKFAGTGFTVGGTCLTPPCTVDTAGVTVTAPAGTPGDELVMWGLGLIQNIDAAAMELYLSWRHFSAKDPVTSTASGAANPPGSSLDDVDIVMAGARIKF